MPVWECVAQDVGDEVEVGGAIDFGNDQGVEVRGLEDGGEILEGEARGDGVDTDAELGDVRGARLGEEGEDVGSRGGFLAWGHRVFEIVGYRVYGQAAGFFEEFR